jgi:hypothetical protein
MAMPALLTRMSRPPRSLATAATPDAAASRSPTSKPATDAAPPAASMASAVSRAASSRER